MRLRPRGLPAAFRRGSDEPVSRTVGNPANAVTLQGYVEKAGQTVTIQAVDQNTGALVTLGTTKAAMSGTPHTTPSGTHYTAYPWSFPAGVLALKYWAPQKIVADLATSQGHLELFATAGGQNLDTFSAAASASAQASGQDPQTAAANFSDGKSTVLFDPNGVGSGPETPWVTVAGMISDSHSPYYSPVAWSIGTYTVENGTKIYALVCAPPEGGPYPVVVFNHGGTGSGDGGNLNGVVTAQGWTVQPVLLGANGQPVIGPTVCPPLFRTASASVSTGPSAAGCSRPRPIAAKASPSRRRARSFRLRQRHGCPTARSSSAWAR